MHGGELAHAREQLLFALVLAGLTGDATFGELLDAIDEYVALSIQEALDVRQRGRTGSAEPRPQPGGTPP